jgi:cytochrome c oxidase assembly factor CtaG
MSPTRRQSLGPATPSEAPNLAQVAHDADVPPPLTPLTLLTSWTFDPLGASLAVILTCTYAVCLIAAHRAGATWSWARSAMFLILGVGTLVYATCGWLAVYRSSLFWVAATQAAVLSAVTAMGLALGDPVALAERASGDKGARWLRRALRGPLPRILMFPLVSSLLAVGSLIIVFFTRYFTASVTHALVREVLYLQLLGTGLLVVLPLLGEDLLPPWCTHPMRALVAFADGLLDAIPGILVMTAPTLLAPGVAGFTDRTWGPGAALDQKLGGGAMIAIAEIVGLPLLTAVFIAWVRADDADARATDAFLDARTQESVDSLTPVLERPWWETDPRFSDRGS